MKTVILIGDGMGDLPLAELGNRTPLQYAETPTMDYLATHGELAMLKTVPDTLEPGSDVANLSLLGYRPEKYYSGRAPLEAASMGITLAADETAFRCNLVNLFERADGEIIMADYSGGHITTADARELIKGLKEQLDSDRFTFYPGISYRHLLVVKGEISLCTTPPHDHSGKPVTTFWGHYQKSPLAGLVVKAREILAAHSVNRGRAAAGKVPANGIWLWGEGKTPSMPTLHELYGLEGGLISAVDLLKGIGVCAGLEIINVPGATGYIDTNYQGKAAAAIKVLEKKDFVVVHVEGPDEASHQGNLKDKITAIEDFDAKIVKPVYDSLQQSGCDYRLAVAMDHYTPISTRTHDRHPVPLVIFSSDRTSSSGLAYTEADAESTGRSYDNGEEFFKRLMGQG
ncbi:MAG: cofactor-independent phosphoglycerate mutase [Proteobacteria bacterium]|nr:cofactor-independent phosphoglycerate mutase [Pseudomonadota bacterium]MBU1739639.1 cofactor-independent phosphoglycerate mutase [Pseudomonadota bacterium]